MMDEVLDALESLKETLTCGYCGDLAREGSAFLCSHVFCSKHISEGKLKCCFICHEGCSEDAVKATDVAEMIKNYEGLEAMFGEFRKEKSGREDLDVCSPKTKLTTLVSGATDFKKPQKLNASSEALGNFFGKLQRNKLKTDPPVNNPAGTLRKTRQKRLPKPVPDETKPIVNVEPKTDSGRILRQKSKKTDDLDISTEEVVLAKPSNKSPQLGIGKRILRKTNSNSSQEKNQTSDVHVSTETSSKAKVSPSAPKPKISPGTSKLKVSPSASKPKVVPSASKTKVSPSASKPKVTPSASKISPSISKVKISPSSAKLSGKNTPQQNCDESISDASSGNARKSLTKRNKKGETPLHAACSRGQEELAGALLRAGADPNTRDNAGWTPLHEAAVSGRARLVEALLTHGALPSPPGPHYDTPLHEAVRSRLPDVAGVLLRGRADRGARNDKGLTPEDLADEDMTRILKESRPSEAVVNTRQFNFKKHAGNAIHIFPSNLTKEHTATLQNLAKCHEDLKIETDFNKSVTHVLVEECVVSRDTLLAVVGGRGVLTCDWLRSCSRATLARLDEFEMKSLGDGQNCVELSIINSNSLRPGLFDGCNFFFIGFTANYEISAHLTVKKQFLCRLVAEGGGTVLKREPDPEAIPERSVPYHAPREGPLARCAHFIVYQNRPPLAYNMEHLKSLPVGWLMECIQSFRLVNPS